MKTILFFIILFAANVIQAVTGFAGTLLAMPVSIQLIGVLEAKVILNIMAFAPAFGLPCRTAGTFNIKFSEKSSSGWG